MKVLVIGGGISDERPVSLRSAAAVQKALAINYETELYDWDGTETWLSQNYHRFDVVFPVLHGVGGEDGQIQAILENLQCRYVGTDAEHSRLCMDKHKTRSMLMAAGVVMPEGQVLDLSQYRAYSLYDKPHVLKPVDGGSSIDTFIFPDLLKRDNNLIEQAFSKHHKLLCEQFIEGQEITAPVLEGQELPVIEIIPPEGGTFDYKNKYNGTTQELCPPQNVPEELQQQAKELAQRCHLVMGCRDLSRTDIMVSGGRLYVLEINTMPGMTDQSLFPRAALQAGLDMAQLTNYLIQRAINRK